MPTLGTYGEGYADGLQDAGREARMREIAREAIAERVDEVMGSYRERSLEAEPEPAPGPRWRDRLRVPYFVRDIARGFSMAFAVSAGAWTFLHEIAGVKL